VNNSRYVDDLDTINDGGTFAAVWKEIYDKSLELKPENEEPHKTHFLDLDLVINDHRIVTSLYDKRKAFPFKPSRFVDLKGNVHGGRSHGMIIGQLLRTTELCALFTDFRKETRLNTTELLVDRTFSRVKLEAKCRVFFNRYPQEVAKYRQTEESFVQACFV
jgi:hypothetical protein